MTKTIRVKWTETAYMEYEADIEVPDTFDVSKAYPRINNADMEKGYVNIVEDDYLIEEGIYEMIQFGNYDEIDRCELETDHINITAVREVE